MSLLAALLLAAAVYSGSRLLGAGTHQRSGPSPCSRLRAAVSQVLGAKAWSARGAPGSPTWLSQAGADVTSGQFVLACTLSAAASALVAWAVLQVPVLAVGGGLAGAAMPVAYWSARRARLQAERAAAWPDAVRYLVGALGSGIATLHEGLEEISRSGPASLRPVFARYSRLAGRVGDKRALEIVRAELADPVADPVLIALVGAVEEGTGTALRALGDIGSQITSDLQLAERARTTQAQSRIATWGCFVVPYVVVAFLCSTNATYRSYFSTASGTVMVVLGGCLSLLGLVSCLRLARPVRSGRRVFVGGGDVRGGS